jgi:uncharacterized protein (TIGR02145 family)
LSCTKNGEPTSNQLFGNYFTFKFRCNFSNVLVTGTGLLIPEINIDPSFLDFGYITINSSSAPLSFTVSGTNMSSDISVSAPTGYEVSLYSNTGYSNSLTLPAGEGSIAITPIYVKFSPIMASAYSGLISISASGSTTQNLAVTGTGNSLPLANAGDNQSVTEGDLVTLDGTASSDPDGNNLTYKWTAPEGIMLSSSTVSNPTFIAPEVTINTNYTFSLIVNDGFTDSPSDEVIITVNNINKSPVANADKDQVVNEGSNVILDGSGSYDPDGDNLTYKWTAPEGIMLSSTTVSNPTFTAPEVTINTNYTFSLIVNDGFTDSHSDEVIVTVNNINKPPIAFAGGNQSADEGTLVTMDGTASSDPDGDNLTYQWIAPEGITLSSTTIAKPTFTAPNVTTNTDYTFYLVVNNGNVDSQADEVVITVLNKTITAPTVSTITPTNILITSAISGGNITSDGGASVTERGVCWSTFENPTIADSKTSDGTGTGIFESSIIGLSPATTYYIRAYATNSEGMTGYGDNLIFTTENESDPVKGTFTDHRDGNEYNWVKIGEQIWMSENLAWLPEVNGCGDGSLAEPRYYVYGNSSTDVDESKLLDNYQTYGVLYNWPAAMQGKSSSQTVPSEIQGACPCGWHLPSNDEWNILSDYLGGNSVAGGKMKETGTLHWDTPNAGATNESGFTALPGGYHYYNYTCGYASFYGGWWSTTEQNETNVLWRHLHAWKVELFPYSQIKGLGLSIRCIKNQKDDYPSANSGFNQSVDEGTLVTLDASASCDPDGNSLTYMWTSPEGITLSSNFAVQPSFTAPEVGMDTNFEFSLVVNNGISDSPETQVIIIVKQINKLPTAFAGGNHSVNEGTLVTLNGSASSDPDGDNLTYQWTAPEGIELSSSTTPSPTFTAPILDADMSYTFRLVVNDGIIDSEPAEVIITVKNIFDPFVNFPSEPDIIWNPGTIYELTWKDFTDPYVRIELLKGSAVVRTITTATPNDGNMLWKVAALPSGNDYKIRIISTATPAMTDMSDNNFTIQPLSYPVVTYPSATDILWNPGTIYEITWQDFTDPYVRVELLKGSAVVRTITTTTANDGTMHWKVAPLTPGNDYRIRITSTATPAMSDISDNLFAIQPAASPMVTYPSASGIVWVPGTIYEITWENYTDPYVRIELLKGGSVVRTVASSRNKQWQYVVACPGARERKRLPHQGYFNSYTCYDRRVG